MTPRVSIGFGGPVLVGDVADPWFRDAVHRALDERIARLAAAGEEAGVSDDDRHGDAGDGEVDGELIEREIGEAIQAVLAEREGGFVLKWVALIETSGPQGDRGMWTLTSDNVKAWDTTGMLAHALHLQQAQCNAAVELDDE